MRPLCDRCGIEDSSVKLRTNCEECGPIYSCDECDKAHTGEIEIENQMRSEPNDEC